LECKKKLHIFVKLLKIIFSYKNQNFNTDFNLWK
jgi:hypothetical protein